MESKGQLTIFELMDEYELMKFKKSSTNVGKPVDKKKTVRPKRVGIIVRR